MVNLTSGEKLIKRSQADIFNFLSDFNHFEGLMPDKVVNWQSDSDKCSFEVDGMAKIGMRIEEKTEPNFIKIVSDGKNPFSFEILVKIEAKSDEESNVSMDMNADMNPMIAMMAKRPLQNLLSMMVDKLQEISF